MEWSIFDEENEYINISKGYAGSIPFLKFSPKGIKRSKSTVIYYHGWRSNKDFKRFQAMSIASFGYDVIVPDAQFHGERGTIDFDDPDSCNKYIWEVILKSISESDLLIKFLKETSNVEESEIILIGSSMGAIASAGIFAKNSKLKGLIGINGIFAWKEAINAGVLPTCVENEDKLMLYDLGESIEKITGRPVLMLHGIEDTSVPIYLQKDFLNKVMLHHPKEKIELITFSNINHRVTTSMLENVIAWLRKNT